MNKEKTNLYQALAELTYSIAMADGVIQPEERRKFKSIIRKELKDDAWIAESRFEILKSAISPDLDKAYEKAIKTITRCKEHFDYDMQKTFVNVVEKVADAFQGEHENETDIIEKLKADIEKISA